VDLVTKGIIDPTKVVRAAPQNAASIAELPITAETMVTGKPKKDDCRQALRRPVDAVVSPFTPLVALLVHDHPGGDGGDDHQ
jgi:hypothetical protein